MANVGGKITLKLLTIVIAIPAGIVTKKVVEKTWTAARPEGTPRKPSEPGVNWTDAIGWAVLSTVGVVVADLIARKGAESTYRALTGSEPPVKQPKHETADATA
jgi:Protein of unknown function (DUF4235)